MIPQYCIAVDQGEGRPCGIVWIPHVIRSPRGNRRFDPTVEAIEERVRSHFGDVWSRWHMLENGIEDLPASQDYRKAWRLLGESIVVDLEQAKELHREKIDRQVATRVGVLQTEIIRALDLGLVEQAQELTGRIRSLETMREDPRIDGARDIETLSAIDPVAEAMAEDLKSLSASTTGR
jgi:hypothetical protein